MSPGNGERRPAGEPSGEATPTKRSVTSLASPTDIRGHDATFAGAELLAQSWGPALSRSFDLGYTHGYARGWLERGQFERESFSRWAAGYRTLLDSPTAREVDARRAVVPDSGCAVGCGRCSACARRDAAARNRERFGTDDYPGRTASAEVAA